MWATNGWLASGGIGDIKCYDFAGSGVVHMVGGVAAFCMSYTIGSRDGRFGKNGVVNSLSPHNLVLAASGALFLLVGWMAFNGGSTGAASGGGSRDAGTSREG